MNALFERTQVFYAVAVTALVLAAFTACNRVNGKGAASPAASIDVAAIVKTAPPIQRSDSWIKLRSGLPVYVGTDGGDATTMSICPSADDYTNFASDCKQIRQGVPAVIDDVVKSSGATADNQMGTPFVKLHASNGSWSGWTQPTLLEARIPIGTILVTKSVGNDHPKLHSRQDSDLNEGTLLDDGTKIKILHYYPGTGNYNIYVEVISGAHAGTNGWLLTSEANTDDGYWANGLSYELATPAPTTDPMKRTYTLSDKLRVFDDLDVCKASFSAMHDDASYQKLKEAVGSGQYHDFPASTNLHIVSDPDPNDLWVVVADDNNNQGCVSRWNLPGYGQ